MAMVQCKECGKDVSSSATQCPHCGKKLKLGAVKKLILGIVGLFVFILIIGAIVGNDSQPPAANDQTQVAETGNQAESGQQEQVAAPTEKKWVIVSQLTGTGEKKGPAFTLTGAEARIRYELGGDIAMLGVYVVEAGTDIMKTGGFPEIMESEAGSGESALHGKRGEYYLNVTGGGRWKVWVEEMR